MTANPTLSLRPRAHEIAIVGNDMLLAALPARPVQLAHAIMACGYDLVVPVSWGEELLAQKALDATDAGDGVARVFCACPRVRKRLLASGPELADHLLSFVAPPVAAARYLRAMQPDASMRITYLGGCEAAKDPSIDARVAPRDFLRHLEVAGISLLRQSSIFDSVVPPDRRRHASLPGGMPAPDFAERRGAKYHMLALTQSDFAADIADKLIADEAVLIDVAASLGCLCAGALPGAEPATARDQVISLEPPRSPSPVVDADVSVTVEAPVTISPAIPKAEEPSPVDARGTTQTIEGVHSIEDARRRTERKRIAVTPASVPPVASDQRPTSTTAQTPHPQSAPTANPSVEAVVAKPVKPSAPPSPAEPSAATEEQGSPSASARIETPSARKVESVWRVVRTATPPHARAGDVSLPRAYAAHRRRAAEAAPESAAPLPVAEPHPTEAPPVPAVAAAVPPEPTPAPAPAPSRSQYVVPSLTQPASFDAARPVLRIPSPNEVNEYVTVKQRMAQRKLHSWPRYVPPAAAATERGPSERFWRMLAYLMLILAIAVATLAIIQR